MMRWLRLIISRIKPPKYGWFGHYKSWKEASDRSGGYSTIEIHDKVKNSLKTVLAGKAEFERNSSLFYKPDHNWSLLTYLFWISAQNEGKISVYDFGGSLGSTYYQHLKFLKCIRDLHWNIIEQDMFVKTGRAEFTTETLKFFNTVEEAGMERDCLLLNCVIPYIEKPYELLDSLSKKGFKYILIIDTPLLRENQGEEFIAIHKVNPEIYDASIPTHLLRVDKIRDFLIKRNYTLTDEIPDPPVHIKVQHMMVPCVSLFFKLNG